MNQITQLIAQLRAELEGNPRLRLGAWAIAAILLFYVVVLVQPERKVLAYNDYATTANRLANSRAVLALRDEWPVLLAEARATDTALQASFWQADTEGLAKAGLQETLEKIVADLDVSNAAIESGSSRPVPEATGLWVQARLTANYAPGVELQLLHAIAKHPRKLVIDRLDLLRGRQSRIVLILSAYFVDLAPDSQ